MRFALAVVVGSLCAPAFAQPAIEWPYPQLTTVPQPPQPLPELPPSAYVPAPPTSPFTTGLPERTVLAEEVSSVPGQQHWVSVNLSVFQPFVGRVGVKVWPRAQNSLWVEAYAGSVLVHTMYGFGVRMQHTVWTSRTSNRLMISPALGVHILPNWDAEEKTYSGDPEGYGRGWFSTYRSFSNTLYFIAGDVDISWLHDFTPHFGFELGVKFGLAGRVAGTVGSNYPGPIMFGKNIYPIFNIYSGFRF